MNKCKHKNTTVVSLDVAYYIECLDCHEQYDESDWDTQKAIDDNAKEAESTGN